MKYAVLIVLCQILAISTHGQERKLVWSDEFEYSGAPDAKKWLFEIGDGCPAMCGWGNHEKQYYTNSPQNARVDSGRLIIEAHKAEYNGYNYTSAKVVSKGKGDWLYGWVEVRARLPKGKGTWPAIWMLPTLDRAMQWPMDGEIDIMEHVGYNHGMIYGTIHTDKFNHTRGTQKSDSIRIDDSHEEFHVYSIDWNPERISWYVDGQVYCTVEKGNEDQAGWPFDKPFHLILNVAVGGDWGGRHGIDENIWPQRMEIDYIRVYQSVNNTPSK